MSSAKNFYLKLLIKESMNELFDEEIEKICYYYDRNRKRLKLLQEQGGAQIKKGNFSSVYRKMILPSQFVAAVIRTAGKYGKIRGYVPGQMLKIGADDRLVKLKFNPVGDVNNKRFAKLHLHPMSYYVGLVKDSLSEFIIVSEMVALKNKGIKKKILNKAASFIDKLRGDDEGDEFSRKKIERDFDSKDIDQLGKEDVAKDIEIFRKSPVRVVGFKDLVAVINLLMKHSEHTTKK